MSRFVLIVVIPILVLETSRSGVGGAV